MKKQLFALLGLGLLLATASAYAQTINLKADVPLTLLRLEERCPTGNIPFNPSRGSTTRPRSAVRGRSRLYF